MKRFALLSAAIGLLPTLLPAEEPVVLPQVTTLQFHAQKGLTYQRRVKVPPAHRIAGIERLYFTLRAGTSGVVRSPEIKFTVGEKPFLIPTTPFVVFDEPPADAVCHVAHAAHPDRPHVVLFRLYHRVQDHKTRINFSRVRFNPTPLGVSSRWINVRNAGPQLYAMTFTVVNDSEHPFTVTKSNFADLPEGFDVPPVTIPPAE